MEDPNKAGYKLTDEQFWSAMEDARGLFSPCVDIIKQLYDIEITRQSIHDRANRNAEAKARVAMIRQRMVDKAENKLFDLVDDADGNISMKAIQLLLKSKAARERGYNEKTEIDVSGEMSVKTVVVKTIKAGAKLSSDERDVKE